MFSFPRHCAQYGHYFIRQLSAATCCQFTVLKWPTVPTAHWCGEVTAESDGRQLWDRIMLTGLIYVCGALLTVCSFIGHKRANSFLFIWGRMVQFCLNNCFLPILTLSTNPPLHLTLPATHRPAAVLLLLTWQQLTVWQLNVGGNFRDRDGVFVMCYCMW